MLLRVRTRIPDVLLIVAGEGPALPGLRRRGRRLGLERHLQFVGYLDRQGPLLDCYKSADLFVFASRTETQGLVLLEALACGVPVVSTAMLGAAEVLHGARGTVTIDEDADAFAAAVIALLGDRERLKAMAAAAKRDAAGRSSMTMAERMLGVYRRLAGGDSLHRHRPPPLAGERR